MIPFRARGSRAAPAILVALGFALSHPAELGGVAIEAEDAFGFLAPVLFDQLLKGWPAAGLVDTEIGCFHLPVAPAIRIVLMDRSPSPRWCNGTRTASTKSDAGYPAMSRKNGGA